jgi:hypothetical protein
VRLSDDPKTGLTSNPQTDNQCKIKKYRHPAASILARLAALRQDLRRPAPPVAQQLRESAALIMSNPVALDRTRSAPAAEGIFAGTIPRWDPDSLRFARTFGLVCLAFFAGALLGGLATSR